MKTINVVYSDTIRTENDLREVFVNKKGLYVVEEDLIFMSLSAICDNSFVRGVAENEGLLDYASNEVSRLAKLARNVIYG